MVDWLGLDCLVATFVQYIAYVQPIIHKLCIYFIFIYLQQMRNCAKNASDRHNNDDEDVKEQGKEKLKNWGTIKFDYRQLELCVNFTDRSN